MEPTVFEQIARKRLITGAVNFILRIFSERCQAATVEDVSSILDAINSDIQAALVTYIHTGA